MLFIVGISDKFFPSTLGRKKIKKFLRKSCKKKKSCKNSEEHSSQERT